MKILFFSFILSLWAAPPNLQPHIRPSLKEIAAKVQKSDEINELFKASLKDPKALTELKIFALEKPNRDLIKDFQNLAKESASFVRGEIEDEMVLSKMLSLLELSLMRVRLWSQESSSRTSFLRIKDECGVWFQFAADLAYSESSLIGLRTTGVIRSLLLDELERLESTRGDDLGKDELWLNWLSQLRAPWPVDRMILTESKRILPPEGWAQAEKVAMKLQKNPYLSVETALKQIPGGKPKEMKVLANLWRDQDMLAMKTEINRLQTLQVKLAARLFKHRKNKAPAKIEELVEARLLSAVPVDYLTGRPMQLPQADTAGKSP